MRINNSSNNIPSTIPFIFPNQKNSPLSTVRSSRAFDPIKTFLKIIAKKIKSFHISIDFKADPLGYYSLIIIVVFLQWNDVAQLRSFLNRLTNHSVSSNNDIYKLEKTEIQQSRYPQKIIAFSPYLSSKNMGPLKGGELLLCADWFFIWSPHSVLSIAEPRPSSTFGAISQPLRNSLKTSTDSPDIHVNINLSL